MERKDPPKALFSEREPGVQHWDYPLFKRRIAEAFDQNLFGVCAYDDLPNTLSLGDPRVASNSIAGRLRQTYQVMLTDGRERGTVIQYDPGTRALQIRRQLNVGDEGHVSHTYMERFSTTFIDRMTTASPAEFYQVHALLTDPGLSEFDLSQVIYQDSALGQLLRQAILRYAGLLHSHPNDATFSPGDIVCLLTARDLKLSGVAFAGTAAVLIPTFETTHISPEQGKENAQHWTGQIDARLNRFRTGDESTNRTNRIKAVDAMARTIAKRFKLGYYTGSLDGAQLSRVV